MIHSKLLTVTTLVSPASHISWINSDSNVIAARSLSDASDICRKEGKNINFIAAILNSNETNKKINFYAVKHKTIIVLRNVWNFVINQIMLFLPTFQLTYWTRLYGINNKIGNGKANTFNCFHKKDSEHSMTKFKNLHSVFLHMH